MPCSLARDPCKYLICQLPMTTNICKSSDPLFEQGARHGRQRGFPREHLLFPWQSLAEFHETWISDIFRHLSSKCFCYVVLLSYCLSISRPIKVMLCGSDVLESFNATKTTGERIWSDEEIEVRGIDESMFFQSELHPFAWFLH